MKNPIPKQDPIKFLPFIYPCKGKELHPKVYETEGKDFLRVLQDRRSTINLEAPSKSQLIRLLEISCKIQGIEIDPTGFLLTKRATPSAGARHPIDILYSLPNPTKNRKFYYYNPLEHSSNELDLPQNRITNFLAEVSQNININNVAIIWFSIQPNKTQSKYENPESLYWRDAGALLYCTQLISTFLNLGTCPIGTLAFDSFNNLFGNNSVISGGGIIVGRMVTDQ